jgi:hypothetical protein
MDDVPYLAPPDRPTIIFPNYPNWAIELGVRRETRPIYLGEGVPYVYLPAGGEARRMGPSGRELRDVARGRSAGVSR